MEDLQYQVLSSIGKLQENGAFFIKDTEIAKVTQHDVIIIRNVFEVLAQDGLIDVALVPEGLSASVTASGRLSLMMEDFYIKSRKALATTIALRVPVEIKESLERFVDDFRSQKKTAFLMMKFEDTPDHRGIVKAIKNVLEKVGMAAVRADETEYHSDIYWNIMTYIYGCSFGIAVFDRISSNDFNPNVAYEVGYLTALGKPVCLLKDKTLMTLHTDLVGKLYRPFSTRNPAKTISNNLTSWLKEKRLIAEAQD